MPARAAGRSGVSRRGARSKLGAVHGTPVHNVREHKAVTHNVRGVVGRDSEIDDWVEPDDDNERLGEGEMEMLLTGHAATHGIEGEDNWLIETEEQHWGER